MRFSFLSCISCWGTWRLVPYSPHALHFTFPSSQDLVYPKSAQAGANSARSSRGPPLYWWGGVTLFHFPHPKNALSLVNCESWPPVNVLRVFSLLEQAIRPIKAALFHVESAQRCRSLLRSVRKTMRPVSCPVRRFSPGLSNAFQSLGVILFLVNKTRLGAPVRFPRDMKARLPQKSASAGRNMNNKNARRLNAIRVLPYFRPFSVLTENDQLQTTFIVNVSRQQGW